jgi:hypothetical protein
VPYPSDTEAAPYDASPYGLPGRKAAPSSIPKTPISMAMTEHHFVLLYQDRVKVIRTLDDRVIYEETLDVVCSLVYARLMNAGLILTLRSGKTSK